MVASFKFPGFLFLLRSLFVYNNVAPIKSDTNINLIDHRSLKSNYVLILFSALSSYNHVAYIGINSLKFRYIIGLHKLSDFQFNMFYFNDPILKSYADFNLDLTYHC